MPNTTGGARAVCPYYVSDDALRICCAGVDKARYDTRFATAPDKRAYMRRYCTSREYWRCPMCEAIDARTQEDPE